MNTATTDFELLAMDIQRQAGLLREHGEHLRAEAERVAASVQRPSRIYLVGCGDSLNVGMAVRFEWERLLRVPVEAIPAFTFSRFAVTDAPPGSLVIGLSQSGTVVRVIEAIRAAHVRGLQTVTVTANESSPLGRERATVAVASGFPKLGFVPGTTGYVYHLQLFYELGLALAGAWGSEEDTRPGRDSIDRLPDLIDASLPRAWEIARDQAGSFVPGSQLLVLGAGPNLATAHFLARKMFEVTQVTTLSQESEEYAHDEYSIVDRTTMAMLVAPEDRGEARNHEILASLVGLRSPVSLATERGAAIGRQPNVRWLYELEPGLAPQYSPLLMSLPAQVFTYELGVRLGGSYYAFDDPIHRRDGDDLIYASQLIV